MDKCNVEKTRNSTGALNSISRTVGRLTIATAIKAVLTVSEKERILDELPTETNVPTEHVER